MRIYAKTIEGLRKEFDDHRAHVLNLLGSLEKEETVRINPDCSGCVRALHLYEEGMKEAFGELETLCRYLDTFASMVATREEDHKEDSKKEKQI